MGVIINKIKMSEKGPEQFGGKEKVSTNGRREDIDLNGLMELPDEDQNFDRRQQKLDELIEDIKKPEKPEKPKRDQEELPPQKNGEGKFKPEKPEQMNAGELPNVTDEPEGSEAPKEEEKKPEGEKKEEGNKQREEKSEGEKKPENQITTEELLDRIVEELNDDLTPEQRKLADEVLAIAKSNSTPADLDEAYPMSEYEANNKINPLAIYRHLLDLSNAFQIHAEAIIKHATGEVVSTIPTVIKYAEKMKEEMGKKNKPKPKPEQAFANVVGDTLAEAFYRKLSSI